MSCLGAGCPGVSCLGAGCPGVSCLGAGCPVAYDAKVQETSSPTEEERVKDRRGMQSVQGMQGVLYVQVCRVCKVCMVLRVCRLCRVYRNAGIAGCAACVLRKGAQVQGVRVLHRVDCNEVQVSPPLRGRI